MSAATASKLMTAEEFLALPDDGAERWLIRGEVLEKRDTDMTLRNKAHSITEARVTAILAEWMTRQPLPRGEVVCGEAGFLLRRDPTPTLAGADVAVISAEQADAMSDETTMIQGPAILIAEILSPSDTTVDVFDRVEEYLECGVKVVWVIHPYFRTVTVHRREAEPATYNRSHTLTGDPELPGFSCPVAAFFR
jgi:Uma2 family endonuclease